MTAQDHLNHSKDLTKRAIACEDSATRTRLWNLAKEHLEYYYQLIEKEDKTKCK